MAATLPTADDVRAIVREELERAVGQLRAAIGGSAALTTEQAAEIAGVGVKTIREWAASGRLTPSRRGRQMRIDRADLARATRGESPDPREAAAESLRLLRGGR